MAEWKKVIVSGSDAILNKLNVSTNQVITNLQATTVLTGSFTGSFSGNGAGLSGLIAATGTVSGSTQILAGLAGTTIHSGSFFNGITVVSGSSQITYSGLTGVPAGIVSGSAQVLNGSGVFSGSAQLPTGIVSGSTQVLAGLAGTTIHSGSFFNGITVVSGSSQISYTGLSNIPASIISASVLSSPGQGQALLTTNGGGGGTIDLGLDTTDSPSFVGLTLSGDLAVNGADITTTSTGTATLFNTNATTLNIGGIATAINIGAATGTTTINNDTRIKGTLYVDGPVTAISSSNLHVADKFILLASGSTAGTDGGIVVQSANSYTGFAFGYVTTADRWVYQDGLAGTASNFGTPTAYANTTEYGLAAAKPSNATGPAYGAGTGYGNTWVSTDTQEIWIYA